jgi:hypothetical protein
MLTPTMKVDRSVTEGVIRLWKLLRPAITRFASLSALQSEIAAARDWSRPCLYRQPN